MINGRSEDKGRQALKRWTAATPSLRRRRREGPRGLRAVVEGTVEFGRIDILVNNAGGAANHAPVVELTDEAMEDALRWNVWSTFWCTRRALST